MTKIAKDFSSKKRRLFGSKTEDQTKATKIFRKENFSWKASHPGTSKMQSWWNCWKLSNKRRKTTHSNIAERTQDFFLDLFVQTRRMQILQLSGKAFFQNHDCFFPKALNWLNTKKILQEDVFFQIILVNKWNAILATSSRNFLQKTNFLPLKFRIWKTLQKLN